MLRKEYPEEFLFSQKLREFFFSVDPNWRPSERQETKDVSGTVWYLSPRVPVSFKMSS